MRALVLLLSIASARVASADVGVVTTGVPLLQAPVMAQVQGWLQAHHYELVGAPLGGSYNTFLDCFVIEDMACARGVFEKEAKASSLVFVRVEQPAGATPGPATREYTITAYWFAKGHPPISDGRNCMKCDDATFVSVVGALMTELASSEKLGKARLKVAATGKSVTVKVGATDLGPTPVDAELAPGTHEISFFDGGAVLERRPIALEPGLVVDVAAPAMHGAGSDPVARRSRLVPAIMMAAGVAAATAGGVFLYYGQIGGPDEPFVYTNATEIGLPLSLAGATAMIVGGVLWFRASPSAARPAVSLSPRGAQLTWTRQF